MSRAFRHSTFYNGGKPGLWRRQPRAMPSTIPGSSAPDVAELERAKYLPKRLAIQDFSHRCYAVVLLSGLLEAP